MDSEGQIGLEIKKIYNLISRVMNSFLPEGGCITGLHCVAIRYLREQGLKGEFTFQRDLEKNFKVRRSTITELLNNMEKNNLIIRETVSNDGRLKKIVPTDKAIKLDDKIKLNVEIMERKIVEGIDENELICFKKVLSKIENNLEMFFNQEGKNV